MPRSDSLSGSEYARLRARVAALDPLILEAVADVDRSLIRWMLSLTPRERLRASTNAARGLGGFKRGSS